MGTVLCNVPSELFLQIHHVLVTLCIVCGLGLHKVVQAAQVVGLLGEVQGWVIKPDRGSTHGSVSQ